MFLGIAKKILLRNYYIFYLLCGHEKASLGTFFIIFFLSLFLHFNLVLVDFLLRERLRYDLVPMEVKRKFVSKAIMKNFSIKLSWPTQKNMSCFHWDNITQDLIFIFTNGKKQ